jgi:putative thiamine transport system ATP-binding protein
MDHIRPVPPRGLLLTRVRIVLNGIELIPETSFTVRPGEVVTIMGPSGSGKSSLLAYLCGTLPRAFQAAGEIWINGVDVTRLPIEERQIGILFQDDLLFPHMTVGENLLFAIPRSVRSRRERRELMRQALAEADLAGYEERDPATLSGGQRARVALMRTLLARPRAVLLDEPFSKLDADLQDPRRRRRAGSRRPGDARGQARSRTAHRDVRGDTTGFIPDPPRGDVIPLMTLALP